MFIDAYQEHLMQVYTEARAQAERLNSRIPSNHPCKEGNGECCKQTDIKTTMGDALTIIDAVAYGEIPDSVAKQALENAQDPSRKFCPFFDEEALKCTIYKHRPIVCVTYGSSSLPEDWSAKNHSALEVDACKSCFTLINRMQIRARIEDLMMARAVKNWIQVQPGQSIATFVRKVFPDLLGPA